MNHRALTIITTALLASGAAWAQERSEGMERDTSEPSLIISKEDLRSTDIREIQSALNSAGYDSGRVDGVWGRNTTKALRDFQQAKGLEANGELDDETILALGFSRDHFGAAAQPVLSKADVRQVQEALNKEGYRVSPVDGIWGPGTESALRDFQQAKGLEATGRLDRETVLALGLSVADFAAGEFDGAAESDAQSLEE